MTSVANQPVGPDGLSRTGAGVKSNVGNRESFLDGAGVTADGKYRQVSAGTPGPANGPGHGLPGATAGTLTGIEKPRKNEGV